MVALAEKVMRSITLSEAERSTMGRYLGLPTEPVSYPYDPIMTVYYPPLPVTPLPAPQPLTSSPPPATTTPAPAAWWDAELFSGIPNKYLLIGAAIFLLFFVGREKP